MKKSHLCLALLFILVQQMEAQIFERSYSAGSSTTVQLMVPYESGKWLVAARGVPQPGQLYHDTLFYATIGPDGKVLGRHDLVMPLAENHFWHDIMVLPDKGVLATYESSYCDFGGYSTHVQRIDAQGNIIWSLSADAIPNNYYLPNWWKLAPDGNLIGALGDKVWKINYLDGSIMGLLPLQDVLNVNAFSESFSDLSDTEDFFGYGFPTIQLWHKSGSSTFPVYKLKDTLTLSCLITTLKPGPNGWFYYLRCSDKIYLERLNFEFEHEVVFSFENQGYEVRDMEIKDSIVIIGFNKDGTLVKKYNLETHEFNDLISFGARHNLKDISIQNDKIGVSGSEIIGSMDSLPWYSFSKAAWFSSFPVSISSSLPMLPDARVIAIQQSMSVDIQTDTTFGGEKIYNLSEGEFKIEVKNEGLEMIDQINLNIALDRNLYYDFCFSYSTQQKGFSNLALEPGESTWIDFGSILGQGQKELPAEICFWTSSPNQQPDAVHENDRFCHPISYTLGFNDISNPSLLLSPNPADDIVQLSGLTERPGVPWSLWDLTGRLVETGICRESALDIDTSRLPNGCYLFQVNHQHAKLMVQHR